jgi:hypothetical protein
MFVNNQTCALVLLFGTNCPYECRNNCQMFAIRLVIFYFFSIYFFLGWNYLCLGSEPLFELSIFTAVDKVKDRIVYNKVWKDNWTYWDGVFNLLQHFTSLIANIWQLFLHSYGQLVPNNNTSAHVWLLTNIENIYMGCLKKMTPKCDMSDQN